MLLPGPRRGNAAPIYTTTVVTASTTYVATVAGVHRIMCLGSGGTGSQTEDAAGACPLPTYAEVELTLGQEIPVTIGAARSTSSSPNGEPGNKTTFGTLVVGVGGEAGQASGNGRTRRAGSGWAGGALNAGSGGALGEDGTNGGVGAGSALLDFLQEKFPDVTLTSGAPGLTSLIGDAGGGAAGLEVNGGGPGGTNPSNNVAGRGSGYGAGGGGATGVSGDATDSNVGVLLIGVPG